MTAPATHDHQQEHQQEQEPLRPPWHHVVAGAAARQDVRPVRSRRVFAQVIAAALAVLVLVAVAGVVASRRLAEAEAIHDASNTSNLLAVSLVQPALTDALVTGQPAAVAAMDEVIRDHVLSATIRRVKIWDATGRIVYSDEARLIGHTFPLGDEEREVLAHGQTRADISDLSAPENRYEQATDRLLEVYRPVRTPSGTPLLFEIYAPYDQVTARTSQLWKGFAGVTLGSLVLLMLLLLPILWRLLSRLKLARAQRESLLQRAVDASTEERRRIAGALHDGVVQDLAATSFSVAGAAERASTLGHGQLADQLHAAATTVRTSIGGLRSLLVEIYPPNLATAGLAAALHDLESSLRSKGVTVTHENPGGVGLDAADERLVFRVAQECFANITRHSAARHVVVRLDRTAEGAVLEISDDGIGFDAAEVIAHPPEGHFGLRVLADVAAQAGAELWLAAAPGAGARWQLRLPARGPQS